MASNLIFVTSNLDNRGDGTSSGTQNLVQISLYSSVLRSKEVSCFTNLELFEQDYKHPTVLFQNDNSNFFNEIFEENSVARDFNFSGEKYYIKIYRSSDNQK